MHRDRVNDINRFVAENKKNLDAIYIVYESASLFALLYRAEPASSLNITFAKEKLHDVWSTPNPDWRLFDPALFRTQNKEEVRASLERVIQLLVEESELRPVLQPLATILKEEYLRCEKKLYTDDESGWTSVTKFIDKLLETHNKIPIVSKTT